MSQRVQFVFSAYTNDLEPEEKKEYSEKLQEHGINECPWGLDEKYYVLDNSKISKLLPDITELDIVDYLYYTKSRHDGNRTENLKSLKSYQNFKDGYLLYKALMKLPSGWCVVLGKVTDSSFL